MTFKRGDDVFWRNDVGEEIAAKFQNTVTGSDGRPTHYTIEVNNQIIAAHIKDVLPPKKPGFKIRDLACTTDEANQLIEGEIVALGEGPNKRKFFALKFELNPGVVTNWYSEDEVFILEPTKEEKLASAKRMANLFSEMNK